MLGERFPQYQPDPGRHDELLDDGGRLRPVWHDLAAELAGLSRDDLARRQYTGERLLEAEGAGHLLHDEGRGVWRLDPIPMLIGAADWTELEAGVAQRARFLDALLADLIGPQRVIRAGMVPVEAVAGSPALQLACRGVVGTGVRLSLTAVDLIRDDRGRWLVLRDHTDAPGGLAATIFHRAVVGQVLPDPLRTLDVAAVEPFLATLRHSLSALAPIGQPSPRIVVLTPGPSDPRFVEHSYLGARLGYHLVTDADLTVRSGRVWLRSLTGLEEIDVVLRFTPDSGSDPLELRPAGVHGVAGLTQASRLGLVGVANALGSALVAELSLAPYFDAACELLLGERLRLPTVTTRWCGDPDQRAEVLNDPAAHVFFERGRPAAGVFVGDSDESAAVLARVRATPDRFVAQKKVRMATTPVSSGGIVTTGRVVLRMHMTQRPEGVVVLPGGQAHVVDTSRPIFAQRGDVAKDVWVVGAQSARPTGPIDTELPQVDFRTSLTSRAAEALFWLGRNAERAETSARYARVLLNRFEEFAGEGPASAFERAVFAGSAALGGPPAEAPPLAEPDALWGELSASMLGRPASLVASLGHLETGAGAVREYLSQTTWRLIASLQRDRHAVAVAVGDRDQLALVEALDRIVLGLAAFAGLSNESVVRGWSWRFLDLGRRVERSLLLLGLLESTLLADLPDEDAPRLHEVVLAACESLVAYRRRYRSDLRLEPMLALLVTDADNPRALAFQLDRIGRDLFELPSGRSDRLLSLVSEAKRGAHADGLLPLVLIARGALLALLEAIHETWFTPAQVPQRLRAGRS
jgi:uncharacterized circularly permuted ATP-grasp superfamily protein/uncharacterized alpha-E superfamily protein